MIAPYIGSGPYCYTNSLLMVLKHPELTPPILETLTGSPFGFQLLFGKRPLFDAIGWDPNLGLDQALTLLGYTWQTQSFPTEKAALQALTEELKHGKPVFVGPIDMGLLKYQPESDRATGADHFVAVLSIENDLIHMHDPQGHPWAALPTSGFLKAWKAEEIGYGEPYSMRTGFQRVREVSPSQALAELLPLAASWAKGRDLPVPPGTLGGRAGLERLALHIEQDFTEDLRGMLIQFGIRVGARRKADGAYALDLIGQKDIADLLQKQAQILGALQYPAVARQTQELAKGLHQLGELHEQLIKQLTEESTDRGGRFDGCASE